MPFGLSRSQYREWRRQQHWQAIAPKWKLSSGITVELRSESEWIVYNDIFVDGEYDKPLVRFLEKSGGPKGVVVDLGANVGFFALRLLHLARLQDLAEGPISYVGVEPGGGLCEEFRRRLSEQPEGLDWKLHRGLAGKKAGEAHYRDGVFHISNRIEADGKGDLIPYLDVESLIPAEGPIGFLKIDIEGSEEAFTAAYPSVLERAEMVVIELHHDLCDTESCRERFRNAGLKAHRVIREWRNYSVEMFEREG